MLNSDKIDSGCLFAKIINMFEENLTDEKNFHAHLFCRGVDTILGDTSDPKEIFSLGECDVCPLGSIVCKANMIFGNRDSNFRLRSGNGDANTFYCHKQYRRKYCRFEDIVDVEDAKQSGPNESQCMICERKSAEKLFNTPVYENGQVLWQNETFKAGTAVYLRPKTFEFKTSPIVAPTNSRSYNAIDENIYTEFYRKKNDSEENTDAFEPFEIGYIQEIFGAQGTIELNVQKLYRPENTHKGITLSQQLDLNLVFWSQERKFFGTSVA